MLPAYAEQVTARPALQYFTPPNKAAKGEAKSICSFQSLALGAGIKAPSIFLAKTQNNVTTLFFAR